MIYKCGPALLAAGLLLGLAGACRAQYGDVDGDGAVTVADARTVLTYVQGKRYGGTKDVRIKRYGDISPVTSTTTFGDGAIQMDDVVRVLKRCAGLETDAPAPDFWPLNTPQHSGLSSTLGDNYIYNDQWGNEATAIVSAPYTWNGYTVRPFQRTDGTEYHLYKDAKGDIYFRSGAMVLQPYSAPSAITFQTPIPILYQKDVARGAIATWSGQTIGDTTEYGSHPVQYTITILRKESTSVPADGGVPFDGTLVVKMAFAFMKTPTDPTESQQSWFFWLAPYVGPIQEGRAAVQSATEPDLSAKPLWRARQISVQGRGYPG